MSTNITTSVVIYVYQGTPRNDAKPTRHASLPLINPDADEVGTLIHASNSSGLWKVEMRLDYNRLSSINIVGSIAVGSISKDPDTILSTLKKVPIGRGVEWNC